MTFYRKWVFPLTAGLLWAAFLTLDLTNLADSTWVKYAAICLCCLTALTGARTADGKLVFAALCFTVGADWFLLVRNDHYTVGVCLFIVVQLLYACRLWLWRGKRACWQGLAARGGALLLSALLTLWDPLSALALFYFANLAVNAAEAFALGHRARRFAWGLLLFVCCDLCVGAYNLRLFTAFTWWGSWLFYLPSQVLIVLSQEPKKEDLHEKRF